VSGGLALAAEVAGLECFLHLKACDVLVVVLSDALIRFPDSLMSMGWGTVDAHDEFLSGLLASSEDLQDSFVGYEVALRIDREDCIVVGDFGAY
jgi:hypothetical protein